MGGERQTTKDIAWVSDVPILGLSLDASNIATATNLGYRTLLTHARTIFFLVSTNSHTSVRFYANSETFTDKLGLEEDAQKVFIFNPFSQSEMDAPRFFGGRHQKKIEMRLPQKSPNLLLTLHASEIKSGAAANCWPNLVRRVADLWPALPPNSFTSFAQ